MRITVFGATGTLGRHIVGQALKRGHEVTAFSRTPEALGIAHESLAATAGDVFDRRAVTDAIRGQDAVVVALGAGMKGQVRAAGTRNIIEAMESEGVSRLIALSTLGAGDSHVHLNFFWRVLMFGLLLRRAMADHEEQEAHIRASNLDWTIVRPAAFTDDAAVGNFKHGTLDGEKGLELKLPRADVAGFMLDQLQHDQYVRRAPALSC